ncbi:MAG: HD domain-containing protein [Syntrophobacterales bacterium]|nr:HD domain-containing protein [Syntrophobacterales bacterium]
MAGGFGRRLYPSLKEVCPDVPSQNFIEELLRVAGLLHDVGHGPYGHFFDDNFLDSYNMTHEDLGRLIICRKLGRIISRIGRSPSGAFAEGELLDPKMAAFLIRKPQGGDDKMPRWLQMLRQLFSGTYTVDNMDYVQRDAFMTGFSLDIVDIERLCFYTFFTKDGLTLHQAGISAFNRFLNARLNLYSNVYFHRTTRALDLHLHEIFRDTVALIMPVSPALNLEAYLDFDEWRLFGEVRLWLKSPDSQKRRLAREWEKLHNREVKWKMSFAAELSIDQLQKGTGFAGAADYEARIRSFLPSSLRKKVFRVDLATQDPRPLNPMADTEKKVNIFEPATGAISMEPLRDIYRFIPARIVQLRVFSLDHEHDDLLARAAERALASLGGISRTNI